MSDEKKRPPERLLRKKCHCGEQLKFFAVMGVPYLPEWLALGIYKSEIEKDLVTIMPGVTNTNLMHAIVFAATCKECGNFSAWNMNKEEHDYLLSNEKEDGYGVAWINNPSFIKEEFAGFPYLSVSGNLLRIAETIEAGSKENDNTGAGDGGEA